MSDDKPDDLTDDDKRVLALAGSAAARDGGLPPIDEEEVEALEEAGMAYDGALPESLQAFEAALKTTEDEVAEQDASEDAPARSMQGANVVSLQAAREARSNWTERVVTFAFGAAAAAAVVALWPSNEPSVRRPEEAAGTPSASASAAPAAPVDIGPVSACGESAQCCAGSACAAAAGENRRCGSGRTCVPCVEDATLSKQRYTVRIGHLYPAEGLDDNELNALDVCARVASSPWDCAPAYEKEDNGDEPAWRTLPVLASAADAAGGIRIELRIRGTEKVIASWHESVRMTPTVLCQGIGVLLGTPFEDFGRLSLFFDDTHFVEIARGTVDELKAQRDQLAFADVTPSLVQMRQGSAGFALVVGPLDQGTAEKLRWSLLEAGQTPRITLGGDYAGEPKPLTPAQ